MLGRHLREGFLCLATGEWLSLSTGFPRFPKTSLEYVGESCHHLGSWWEWSHPILRLNVSIWSVCRLLANKIYVLKMWLGPKCWILSFILSLMLSLHVSFISSPHNNVCVYYKIDKDIHIFIIAFDNNLGMNYYYR